MQVDPGYRKDEDENDRTSISLRKAATSGLQDLASAPISIVLDMDIDWV
jgi:hypothetical protein